MIQPVVGFDSRRGRACPALFLMAFLFKSVQCQDQAPLPPDDFLLSLSREEIMNLSQIVISSNIKHAPNVYAFTEQGIAMLSGVLNSERAIEVNIQIMRAFVRLREMFATNKEFAHKLAELERKVESHDEAIRSLVIAIKDLLVQPEPKHHRIGFL